MDLTFETIYENLESVFQKHTINLRNVGFLDTWCIGLACLKAIEYMGEPDKELVLPSHRGELVYLKRMHFNELMKALTYNSYLGELNDLTIHEQDTLNVHEILHCPSRDVFDARLSSRIRLMFRNFGMNDADEQRATAIVGELGNNVFDHNGGAWPTNVSGAIIIAQRYPRHGTINVVVADPGVGFLNSLRLATPKPKDDIEAIKLGLSGVTGRIGERRGNGLKLVQEWTIRNFKGIVRIHSGKGLVEVDNKGERARVVTRIVGTLAQFTASNN